MHKGADLLRHPFKQHRFGAGLVDGDGILNDRLGACRCPPLGHKTTHGGRRLRRQPHMAKDHNAALCNGLNFVGNSHAALQLNGVYAALFDKPHGVSHGILRGSVIRAKRHVPDEVCVWCSAANGPAVGNRHIHCDGSRPFISVDRHAHGVAA
ncbi:hypothetical protein SDC9_138717 [bioreactor metagenome]|uniref:Uncharacterized protein n=1 Tax=bioreactor metagenome TaxID=1076179 RepID=A0A645DQJ9_9ZZZZ